MYQTLGGMDISPDCDTDAPNWMGDGRCKGDTKLPISFITYDLLGISLFKLHIIKGIH